MIKKKIAMLGAFAVGKTSLVQQYVHSIFSDKYQTTIGVKIDQKQITVSDQDITLMLWDLYGDDDFMKMKPTYLIGASGYILVADGTRSETIDVAMQLQEMAAATTNNAPFLLIINKSDLSETWEIAPETILRLQQKGWIVLLTSAKKNLMVEEAFQKLASLMLNHY
ncbi:MAG TPA: Rab family GTPase [Bacteroidales bacterium]|nr:Rab family GTPase [Bacteroidales bacterium]